MPDIAMCNNRYCPSQDECARHTHYALYIDGVYRKFRFECGRGKCYAFISVFDDTAYREFQRVNKVAA